MSSNNCNSVCKYADKSCNTEMEVHEVKYVWTIDNFDFHEAKGSILETPTFSADTNRKVKWYLKLKTNGETDAKDTISVFLYLSSIDGSDIGTSKKILAKFNVFTLDCEQRYICDTDPYDGIDAEVNEFKLPPSSSNSWGLCEFLKKDDYFRDYLLFHNKLTICCKIMFSFTRNSVTTTVHHCKVTPLYSEAPACNIVENLETLLENHEFSDIVLCVKEQEYPAHKLILAARSSVFAAMFKHNLKENQTNRIKIEDMNEEVVAEMLRYIYTGKCENSEKLADGLLVAADKYDLDRLKMICAEALLKTLSVDNAVNILALADLHSVQELKSKVIEFIVAKFGEVVDSTAWQNILVSHAQLVNEVCKAVAGRSTVPNKRKNQDSSSECKRNRIE